MSAAPVPVVVHLSTGTDWASYLASGVALALGLYSIVAERQRGKAERAKLLLSADQAKINRARNVFAYSYRVTAADDLTGVTFTGFEDKHEVIRVVNASDRPVLDVYFGYAFEGSQSDPSIKFESISTRKGGTKDPIPVLMPEQAGVFLGIWSLMKNGSEVGLMTDFGDGQRSRVLVMINWTDVDGERWSRLGLEAPRRPLTEHGGRGKYGDNPRFSRARLRWEFSTDGRRIKKIDREREARRLA